MWFMACVSASVWGAQVAWDCAGRIDTSLSFSSCLHCTPVIIHRSTPPNPPHCTYAVFPLNEFRAFVSVRPPPLLSSQSFHLSHFRSAPYCFCWIASSWCDFFVPRGHSYSPLVSVRRHPLPTRLVQTVVCMHAITGACCDNGEDNRKDMGEGMEA